MLSNTVGNELVQNGRYIMLTSDIRCARSHNDRSCNSNRSVADSIQKVIYDDIEYITNGNSYINTYFTLIHSDYDRMLCQSSHS